ncbi:MAG: hypothetical protein JWP97_4359 [Labilithrix sp.]|nr:hypothetical protein [Labilithrix sp.]
MSWLPAVVQSRIDEGRHRLEDLERAATDKVHEVRERAGSAVQAVRSEAAVTLETGAGYANDVADFAKNAAGTEAASATPTAGGIAARAVDQVPKPLVPPAKPDLGVYTDEALDHAVTAQQLKVNGMPAGPEREVAERELRALESEARNRAERPEDAATPRDDEPPSPTLAERLRPPGMFLAGVATGLVSGSLGPPGAAAQTVLDAKVEANGTSTDRFAFGLGQEVAGAFHVLHGIEMGLGSAGAEAVTGGAATPVAAPVGLLGAMEVAGGVSLVAGGQHLAATGTVKAPAAEPSKARTPTGIADKHIMNGEVKYDKAGHLRAVGFHHQAPGTEANARIVKGTVSKLDEHGCYTANVEIKDPKTGRWILKQKPSSFFPQSWDRSQVRKTVLEAYANREVLPDGNWIGKTSSGITVHGYTDAAGRITSAYPDI